MNAANSQLECPPRSAFAGVSCREASAETPPSPALPRDPWAGWDAFLENTEATGFMQSSWWTEFHNFCGFENFGITFKDGSDMLGGAIVQRLAIGAEPAFYYIQDGPVLPADPGAAEQVFHALLGEIERRRESEPTQISHLRIEPRWVTLPDYVRGFRPIRPLSDSILEARDTRCIDLRPSETEILAQMKPKGRYNIGVAKRHGVSIVEDTSARGIADFLRIYNRTAVRQGLRAKPTDYFRALVATLCARERGSLFFAEYQGRRLATALVVYFGNRATYFYGGSLAIHRPAMAPYLLHFEVMRKAKSLGMEWYDLWGIAPRNEPDHPWQNISAFKAKFGGLEVNLVPTLDLVYDAGAYERFLVINKR